MEYATQRMCQALNLNHRCCAATTAVISAVSNMIRPQLLVVWQDLPAASIEG